MDRIGTLNVRALSGIRRPIYAIEKGEEFIIRSGNRSFILRGTLNSLQVFGREYAKEDSERIFAGTINGIVTGQSFNVGYEKDIIVKDIETLEI